MKKFIVTPLICALILIGLSIIFSGDNEASAENRITIAGSSTVYPISSEATYQYSKINPDAIVSIESTGTGGGFELFDKGETDINNASRAINEDEKFEAQENGVEYTELHLAADGITVIVNPANDWVNDFTVEQLKMIFDEDGNVQTWSDIDPSWPDEKINLYGPTSASGTYDFFCEEVVQEEGEDGCSIRSDMSGTENDNEVVKNLENDIYGIGFLGYAYYTENSDEVKDLKINGVEPTIETIKSGEYYLSRPLYMYVNNERMASNAVLADYVKVYMDNIAQAAEVAGYVPLTEQEYEVQRAKLTN